MAFCCLGESLAGRTQLSARHVTRWHLASVSGNADADGDDGVYDEDDDDGDADGDDGATKKNSH